MPPAINVITTSPIARTPIEPPPPWVAAVVKASTPEGRLSPLASGGRPVEWRAEPFPAPGVPAGRPVVEATASAGAPNAGEVAMAWSWVASRPPWAAIW
jgi:hypothetical protein